jgi:hypothetical protein
MRMSDRIQGEEDYEAACRFNEREREFIRRKFGKHKVTADFPPERSEAAEAEHPRDLLEPDVTEHDEEYVRRLGIEVPRSNG